MTTSEHADLIRAIRTAQAHLTTDGHCAASNALQKVAAALASTPSPAQPTECEHGIALADLCAAAESHANAPSPVQGADDRLATPGSAFGAEDRDWVRHLYNKAYSRPPVVATDFDTRRHVEALDAVLAEAERRIAIAATYQQSPQAALNEVRAGALEDAAIRVANDLANEHGGHTSTASVRRWLRARAAELRAAPQTGATG